MIETKSSGFADLHDLWQAACSFDSIPNKVPTSEGAVLLNEIYVTSDKSIMHDLDDSHIVFLSPEVAHRWIERGAKPLKALRVDHVRRRLSDPACILDMFPEFTVSNELMANLDSLSAVWAEGIIQQFGCRKCQTNVAMDPDGLIFLDRSRFSDDRSNAIEILIRYLSHFELIPSDLDLYSLLEKVLDRHTENARSQVRSQPNLPARLLQAVGNNPDALLAILSSETRKALGNDFKKVELANLALAVHGPSILIRLYDELDAQGLAPPDRWSGEPARTFVQDLGFPPEFASTVGGRMEAELSVSGPINLPDLHNYQREILNHIEIMLSSGIDRRRAVISLPTGGGKTRVAAEAVVRLVLRSGECRSALWIAQTEELCEQAVQCFRQLWINIGASGEELRIVRLWGGQRNPSPSENDVAVVVVASIQTLSRRIPNSNLAWITKAGIIIIDECHHAIAPSYTDLLRWLNIQVGTERSREYEPPVLGLSATPWRGYDEEESDRLAARFDRCWFPVDQAGLHQTLTKMGVLSDSSYTPLRHDRPVTLTSKEKGLIDTYRELPPSVIHRIGEDDDRNLLIVNSVMQSSARSVLLFANSVKHAQYLAARLHLAGCPSAAVSGQTNRLARQYFTRKFRSGELRVICNHSVLTTGFDAPKADMILISRPVMSPVLYMQMVGRGLRGPENGGTSHCKIVTVEDNIVNYEDKLAYHFCRRYFKK